MRNISISNIFPHFVSVALWPVTPARRLSRFLHLVSKNVVNKILRVI